MGILGWIVFGVIVGAVAKLVMPGKDPGGFIVTILLGIVGAVAGGWIGRGLGLYGPGEPAGFLMAVLGAVVVLAIYRASIGRRRAGRRPPGEIRLCEFWALRRGPTFLGSESEAVARMRSEPQPIPIRGWLIG